jgi:uncharacterized membrane protein YraQ (UPF0718 family)
MLDPIMTVVRPVAGFFTAIATGIAQNFFGHDNESPSSKEALSQKSFGCGCTDQSCRADAGSPDSSLPLGSRLMKGIRYAYGELLTDIAKPFLIGILIAGAITFFFPEDLTLWANDHRFASMIVMLIAGIPMYVCATSSTPIAAALILKGLNPGAALVFLIAGPATNAATINIVKNIFNTRALMIYLGMISICAVLMGFLLDTIYDFLGIKADAVIGQAAEIIPYPVQLAAALVLTLMIMINFYLNSRSPDHDHL